MEVVVTGGAGFIGSHLVETLIARGHSVTVIDDLSTGSQAHLGKIARSGRLRIVIGDAANPDTCSPWIERSDVVFHLAAAVGVRLVLERPVRAIDVNVETTRNVLELASRGRTAVFLASSSEVYGNAAELPFREDQPLRIGPAHIVRWGYACSKAMCEFLALAYHTERGLPVTIGRLFNVAGPRQTDAYGMVLPTFVRQALYGEPITVFGDGTQTRCFVHVRDVVSAIVRLMQARGVSGEIFNIGGDREVSIGALARRVKQLTDSRSDIVYLPYRTAYGQGFEDMRRRVPDLSRIGHAISYEPGTRLDDIIESVIHYERDRAESARGKSPTA